MDASGDQADLGLRHRVCPGCNDKRKRGFVPLRLDIGYPKLDEIATRRCGDR
jgi:hypothetical protein